MSYSPTLGRWIEQDPAGYVDGANRYQALISNPVNYIDPVGLSSETGKYLKKETIKFALDQMAKAPSRAVQDLGQILGGANAIDKTRSNIAKMVTAAKLIIDGKILPRQGFGLPEGPSRSSDMASAAASQRNNAWDSMTQEIGEEAIKKVIGLAAEAGGASRFLGGIYAAVAIDAIKIGSSIGTAIASFALKEIAGKAARYAEADRNLKSKGTLAFVETGVNVGLYAYRDNQNKIWIYTPKINCLWGTFSIMLGLSDQEHTWVTAED